MPYGAHYVVAVVWKFVFYLRMNMLYLVYKNVTLLKYFDPFSMFNLTFRSKLSTEIIYKVVNFFVVNICIVKKKKNV